MEREREGGGAAQRQKKYALWLIQRRLRHPNQLAAMAEFWFLADWPPYSQNLNSLNFSTGSVLQPKGQAMPHANLAALRLSVARNNTG
jgi:hypothetical protein